MIVIDSKETIKAWYKFALETVKLHRSVGGHRNNRAFHAQLLDDAHFWLGQLRGLE